MNKEEEIMVIKPLEMKITAIKPTPREIQIYQFLNHIAVGIEPEYSKEYKRKVKNRRI